jgi:hypothetical protein
VVDETRTPWSSAPRQKAAPLLKGLEIGQSSEGLLNSEEYWQNDPVRCRLSPDGRLALRDSNQPHRESTETKIAELEGQIESHRREHDCS